jgi:hypothetical protein
MATWNKHRQIGLRQAKSQALFGLSHVTLQSYRQPAGACQVARSQVIDRKGFYFMAARKAQRQAYGAKSLANIIRTMFGAAKPITYREYIKSPAWRQKAEAAKKRAGYRCEVCNSPENLNAHHRCYDRLFIEEPGDITVLCRECHQLFSKNGRLAK